MTQRYHYRGGGEEAASAGADHTEIAAGRTPDQMSAPQKVSEDYWRLQIHLMIPRADRPGHAEALPMITAYEKGEEQ